LQKGDSRLVNLRQKKKGAVHTPDFDILQGISLYASIDFI